MFPVDVRHFGGLIFIPAHCGGGQDSNYARIAVLLDSDIDLVKGWLRKTGDLQSTYLAEAVEEKGHGGNDGLVDLLWYIDHVVYDYFFMYLCIYVSMCGVYLSTVILL